MILSLLIISGMILSYIPQVRSSLSLSWRGNAS